MKLVHRRGEGDCNQEVAECGRRACIKCGPGHVGLVHAVAFSWSSSKLELVHTAEEGDCNHEGRRVGQEHAAMSNMGLGISAWGRF